MPRPTAPGRRELPSFDEVNLALCDRLEELCFELFPAGRVRGRHFYIGGLAGHAGDAMEVNLSGGSKRGLWKDFSADIGGRPFNLVAHGLFGGDNKKAWRWVMGWLGWDTAEAMPARDEGALAAKLAELRERERREEAEQRGRALALWDRAVPVQPDDPAWCYLAGRGIDLARLEPQPRALRFLADCYNADLNERLPALVALVVGEEGARRGVHRTYLRPLPGGGWDRLRGDDIRAKVAYGPVRGGCIPLWRGQDGLPFFQGVGRPGHRPGAARPPIAVSEGIEDGLSVALMKPEWRVAAAVAVSMLGEVPLKAALGDEELIWLGQNDPALHPDPARAAQGVPHPVHAALARQFERLAERGITVRKALPPAEYKDWNDVLLGRRLAGGAADLVPA